MGKLYIISPETKAIMRNSESSYYRSKVLEGKDEKISIHRPEQIIDNSCLLYGSDLKGRKEAVQKILCTTSKLPVPISPTRGVFMFPTSSIKNKDCVWIAFHHVKFYEQRDDKTYIGFIDETGIYVNVSENTIDTQYKRTSQVIVHYNRRVLFGFGKDMW
ncbi:competence protein ComK [Oceanobacillus polygoni]|uniref:Competence protein ComK n=1 Tax=Oceanobacillus polygoni TaxID=1235259 RepID=A0A9X0YS43_9BACI|nr:competence protein ComK [Oceanobacillus polygoni]MBP2076184.1 competence protein ComK [Oceanobacillus polygoni]